MTIFQIVALLFALFMIYVVSIHIKKQTLSVMETSFWCTTWIMFAIVALFPDLLLGIMGALRFARVFDLLLVIALMVLTVVIFMSYFAQKDMKRKLEDFVREQAIQETVVKNKPRGHKKKAKRNK